MGNFQYLYVVLLKTFITWSISTEIIDEKKLLENNLPAVPIKSIMNVIQD